MPLNTPGKSYYEKEFSKFLAWVLDQNIELDTLSLIRATPFVIGLMFQYFYEIVPYAMRDLYDFSAHDMTELSNLLMDIISDKSQENL